MEKKSSSVDFTQKQRLDPKAVVIIFANFLWRTIYPLFILYFLYKEYLDQFLNPLAIGGLIIIGLVYSFLYYRRFVYYLDQDELILEKGVLVRRKLSIKFDKIQHINTEQNVLYQIFDLKKVMIDTAGSEGKEFVLPGLTESTADALQNKILQTNKRTDPDIYELESAEGEEIEKLSIGKLIMSSLIGNPFGFTGTILFFVFSNGIENFEFIEYFIDIDDIMDQSSSSVSWLLVAEIILGFVFISIISEIFINLTSFYDFQINQLKDFLVLKYGMFQRVNHSLSRKKVQMLLRKSNGLSRLLGFSQVKLFQVSPIQTSAKKIEKIPYVSAQLNDWLEEWALGKNQIDEEKSLKAHPIYGVRQGFIYSLMLLVVMGVVYSTLKMGSIIYIASAIPFIILYFYFWGRKAYFIYDNNWIFSSKGWWGVSESLARSFKLQAISMRQSIFQRRRKTANLYFYLASSTIVFPEIPYDQAMKIYSTNLQQIINDPKKAWM